MLNHSSFFWLNNSATTYKSRSKKQEARSKKQEAAPSLLFSSLLLFPSSLTSHNPSFPIPSHIMASASLSAVAGAILSPILPQIALDKLITYLWDYLSRDHPSSSGEAAMLQQLQKEWEALEDANPKLKTMQTQAKRSLKKDMQNVTVVRLLKKMNDVGYEIQDLESDMEYMELQRKVEERDQAEADMSQSIGRKRWFSFPWAKGQSNEKRRRLSSSDQSLKLPLDDMVNRISSLIKQINSIDSEMITQIKVDEWFKEIKLNGIYDPWEKTNKRVTTSSTNERKIYGREYQTKRLIKVLMERPNVNGNISVFSILGMGGIGKTTLAQFVFNNPEIENYFDKKVWVFVSDHFDRFRITKEIVESLSSDTCPKFPYDTTNLDFLEKELKRRLIGKKKFLLVLDDVWSDEWQQLLAPLRHTKVESIKIIVTGRDPTVLAEHETRDRFLLGGLYGDSYKSFFIDCIFGNENPDNYSSALQSIGKQIMEKLNGSPLAVKTVGRLLGRNLTEEHWKHVLDSDLWEIGGDANDIMPALAMTFHHLPEHLQLCFALCSVFPKGHHIHTNELIGMWIAHGYILESGTNSKTLEDIGEEYFEELNQLSLIEFVSQKVKKMSLCKMHDVLHDLAQSVSQGEVCIDEGKRGKRISRNVRHLCVCGPVDLESVVRISNSLRTLVLYGDDICSQVDLEAFKRIRVLVVFDKNMQEFPEAVTHLKHLRYLDFSRSNIKWVPESLCRLYQLRVLRLPQLNALPSLFHSFINLRSCRIAQLRNMNELTGSLEMRGLENIENKEEAMKANLNEKGLIKRLNLCWEDSVGAGCTHDVQEEVFEGLQPHHNVKHLVIQGYMGSKSPSWLWTTPALHMLRRMELDNCRNWSCLPPSIGLLPFLEYLSLIKMENIIIEGDNMTTMIFPSLKELRLSYLASISFEGMSLSSSSSSTTTTQQTGGRKLFPLLEELTVSGCDVVNGLPWPVLSQLSELDISDSRGLDAQLPGCLKGLKSLTRLEICGSKCETLFDREVMATLERLKDVKVGLCNELISVDGLQVLPSLTSLRISFCRKLRWWWVEEGTSEQQGVLLPKLSYLSIRDCEDLESLPACLPLLPCLERLSISGCHKLRWWWVEEGTFEQRGVLLPKLSILDIWDCEDLESLPAWLPLLPSLERLEISKCPKVRSLPEEGTSEPGVLLPKLSKLDIRYCEDLESLPAWLPLLASLTSLSIDGCRKLRWWWVEEGSTSEQQQGVLLPKLSYLYIRNCEDLESLPAWLPLLPSLRSLEILDCPKVRSLPEGGLPSSLRRLEIKRCDPGFMERCQQELSDPEWHMIRSHAHGGQEYITLERKQKGLGEE